jgi:hypothetical protein
MMLGVRYITQTNNYWATYLVILYSSRASFSLSTASTPYVEIARVFNCLATLLYVELGTLIIILEIIVGGWFLCFGVGFCGKTGKREEGSLVSSRNVTDTAHP